MKDNSHLRVSAKAFAILDTIDSNLLIHKFWESISETASKTDHFRDLEFVNVQLNRDNPHSIKSGELPDIPSYQEPLTEMNYTAFNHFIDIKKGPGEFDDYDGYSYRKGSASRDEYQTIGDAYSPSTIQKWIAGTKGISESSKVDSAINCWLDDEYVHAPGFQWYSDCSPSVKNYSFFEDKNKYQRMEDEAKVRFPLASSSGGPGEGIPYSIFMPIDNLARYWYQRSIESDYPDISYLGHVLHAIQDVSIPHHAAGYNGNWHGEYESLLNDNLWRWTDGPNSNDFCQRVRYLFDQWNREDSSPPLHLNRDSDWNKIPARNWRIDMLVTWMALNAYRVYSQDCDHFREGWMVAKPHEMQRLLEQATALSLLVLHRVKDDKITKMVRIVAPSMYTIESREPREKVTASCDWTNMVKPVNIRWTVYFGVGGRRAGERIRRFTTNNSNKTITIDHLIEGKYTIRVSVRDSLGREAGAATIIDVVKKEGGTPL